MSFQIDFAGEGPTDAILAARLIRAVGGQLGVDYVNRRRAHGKHRLDGSLAGLVIAARHGKRVLVLRDLDHDEPCPGALVARLAPGAPAGFCLRVAVRAAEAWLLADRTGIARALGIRVRDIPSAPESLNDPKQTLRDLGRSACRSEVRRRFDGTWQEMQGWVADFLHTGWDPLRAATVAPSLARALDRIRTLCHG